MLMPVLVIYFLLFALLGVYISTAKGRSPGEGLILGVILGPIGLLIDACLPTIYAVPEVRRRSAMERIADAGYYHDGGRNEKSPV
jgi:hypothetical protein